MAIAVRGQRLFIRPIGAQDHDAIHDFLARHGHENPDVPLSGAVGKLVGDLVAVAATTEIDDTLRLDDLFVAPELRRKRIGRVMIDEQTRLALASDKDAPAFAPAVARTAEVKQWTQAARHEFDLALEALDKARGQLSGPDRERAEKLRSEAGIKPGDRMVAILKSGVLMYVPVRPLRSTKGMIKGLDTRHLRDERDRF